MTPASTDRTARTLKRAISALVLPPHAMSDTPLYRLTAHCQVGPERKFYRPLVQRPEKSRPAGPVFPPGPDGFPARRAYARLSASTRASAAKSTPRKFHVSLSISTRYHWPRGSGGTALVARTLAPRAELVRATPTLPATRSMPEPAHFPLFTDLRASLGETGARALVRLFGATVMLVPTRAMPADPLVLLLGSAAAERLVGLYGGSLVQIPPRAWRADEIAALKGRGLRIPEIASLVGLTTRRIQQVLASARANRGASARA